MTFNCQLANGDDGLLDWHLEWLTSGGGGENYKKNSRGYRKNEMSREDLLGISFRERDFWIC